MFSQHSYYLWIATPDSGPTEFNISIILLRGDADVEILCSWIKVHNTGNSAYTVNTESGSGSGNPIIENGDQIRVSIKLTDTYTENTKLGYNQSSLYSTVSVPLDASAFGEIQDYNFFVIAALPLILISFLVK